MISRFRLALLQSALIAGALPACGLGAIAQPDEESAAAQSLQAPAPRSSAPELPQPWTPTPAAAPTPTRTPTVAVEPSATAFATGPFTIGQSVAGRPLEMVRFGHGPKPYLIVAGIHGGYEWNTIALARELIDHLFAHPELIPRRISLYILPSFNVDGEARSASYAGRANERGVDLNRNWPSLWQADWPKAGCWNYLPIHGGTGSASEPEVVWLMDFILRNRIEAIISYHSAALGIFPGGQPPLPESVSLAEAVAEVAPYPYPPIQAGCLYTGQFADWAADQGIPALDVELSDHSSTDFEINLQILETFLNWRP